MLIPLMHTICLPQRLNHEDFDAAPRALVVSVVDEADHAVALRKVHGQGGNARPLMILVYASKVLSPYRLV